MLKSIENSFSASSGKVKLQLFILPLFFIYFYIYFYTGNNAQYIINENNKLDALSNKKFNKSYLELTKEIENYCDLKKIEIYSMDYKKKNLFIKGKTTLLKIQILIKKLEALNNYSNINLLNISKIEKKNEYNFEINTEFKKYYIKKKEKKIKNKETKIKAIKVKKVESKESFKLKAIVSNYILINNKWYTINETVGKYKIITISKNNVFLKYKNKDLNLRVYKDE